MEKRKFSRIPFQIKAEMDAEGQKFEGEVDNFSLKGMFVKTEHTLENGTSVFSTVKLTGTNSSLIIQLKGRVVRTTPEGIGIFFEEMDLDSFIHLKNIIDYNTADPDKVKDEFMEYVRESISKNS